jgi:hypothetical protein
MRSEPFEDRRPRRPSVRRLVFDSLEDRRLLAGLEVFVYDDANANLPHPPTQSPLTDRVVYLDTDRDGTWSPGEPLETTGLDGVARFDSLEEGDYLPALWGQPAGEWLEESLRSPKAIELATGLLDSPSSIRSIVQDSSGGVWVAVGSQLQNWHTDSTAPETSIELPGRLLDLAFRDDRAQAIALVEAPSTQRLLVVVDAQNAQIMVVPGSEGIAWTRIAQAAGKWMAETEGRIEGSRLHRIDPQTLAIEPQRGLDWDRLANWQWRDDGQAVAWVETGSASSRMVVYQEIEGAWIQQPSVTLPVTGSWQLASGWKLNQPWVLISDPLDQVAWVDPATGQRLAQNVVPPSAVILAVDAGGILTFDRQDASLLLTQRGLPDAPTRLRLPEAVQMVSGLPPVAWSPERASLWMVLGDKILQWDLDSRVSSAVKVAEGSTAKAAMGLQRWAANAVPVGDQTLLQRSVLPGEVAVWTSEDLEAAWSDRDDDPLLWQVTRMPLQGQLEPTADGGWAYTAPVTFQGSDSWELRAYDGVQWSPPLSIDVMAQSLPPSLQWSIPAIAETVEAGTQLGTVWVEDSEADATYRITTTDTRFVIQHGKIFAAAEAVFDYESQASFVMPLVATRLDQSESGPIRASAQVTIEDANEKPVAIHLSSRLVLEDLPGAIIGDLQVEDPDRDEVFRWYLSDDRFQVRDGKLQLAPGVALDFESQAEVPLMITAIDRGGFGYQVSTRVDLQVTDRDDPTRGITLDKGVVVELVRGYRIAEVAVIDPDRSEKFDLTVSEPRMEIEQGLLKLRRGIFIDRSQDVELPIRITATSQTTGKQFSQDFRLRVLENQTPWRNASNPMDVDGDGVLSPRDPLRIINHINRFGPHPLGPAPDSDDGQAAGDYLDVNGDGDVSPIDILIVINKLNQQSGGTPPPASGGGGPSGGDAEGQNGGAGAGQGEGEGEDPSDPPMELKTHALSLQEFLKERQRKQASPPENPLRKPPQGPVR